MYKLNNESLRNASERHKTQTGMEFSDEVNLLRGLIESVANSDISDAEKLAKLEKPLSVVVSAVQKLHKLKIAQNQLLGKDALHVLGAKIVTIISEALLLVEDQATRDQVTDYVATRIVPAIESATNNEPDIKPIGYYNTCPK